MDEPAHGGQSGPAELDEAGPSETKPDAPPREPIADAIPTVKPYELPLPPQTSPERSQIDGASEVSDVPAAERAVVGLVDPWLPPDEPLDVPMEPGMPGSDPSALTIERSPEPSAPATTVEIGEVPMPVAADVDIFTTAPTEQDEPPAHPDPSASLDSPEAPSGEMHPISADAQFDAGRPDVQPVPIRAEQIWSTPETSEPHTQWVPERQVDGREAAPDQARVRVELTDPAQQAPQTVLAPPLHVAPFHVAQPAASWPSVSLPSRETVGGALSYLRLGLKVMVAAVAALTVAVLMLVILYRWVDPPTSTLMLGQRLGGTQIEHRWVPIERISPQLIQAVILSEDGGFCRHRGVDWSALEEAIESSRGGSTITMQVVKNLFLWPARSYVRKALEIGLAYLVEMVWPKQRVLEIYLNIAEWGPGVFGAEAAARHHFGKGALQLTAQEAALLAVSLPSPIEREPGYPAQQTRRLANNLLTRMRAVRTTMRCVQAGRAELVR